MALRVVLNVPVAGRPLNDVGNVDIVFGLSWHFAGPTEEKAIQHLKVVGGTIGESQGGAIQCQNPPRNLKIA